MLNERLPVRVASHDGRGGADKLPEAVTQAEEPGVKWGRKSSWKVCHSLSADVIAGEIIKGCFLGI